MWQARVAKDLVTYRMPFAAALRSAKRRLWPYATSVGIDSFAFEQGLVQCEALLRHNSVAGSTVLELGSGWQPTIPMLFRVCGAARIILTDRFDRMDAALVQRAVRLVEARAAEIIARLNVPAETIAARLAPPAGTADRDALLAWYGMEWHPAACLGTLPPGSVDIVISRAVLEHVQRPVLPDVLAGLARVLREGGWASHVIDNSDHYEHADKSISRLNFLRFGDGAWRALGLTNPNLPNRVRHSEYLAFLRGSGLRIEADEPVVDEAALQSLRSLPLAPRFREFDLRDLAALTSCVLARKPAAA